MHVLVTGHTGFKGAWLSLMLAAQGHEVSGISLDPRPQALFRTARVAEVLREDARVDIRDERATREAVAAAAPDVVIHMAAQPLVRESYRDPRTTYTTNVLGTLNVLEAVDRTPSVKSLVVITTDKVYRNVDRERGYSEEDALGAGDPYSSSKAMADILTQSWMLGATGPATGIARGGNVIGGGDDSADRLVPDLMRAFAAGETPILRFPGAVRPWQHVLDCLDGYLTLAWALLEGRGVGQWNFGPGAESFLSVGELATTAAAIWGDGRRWELSEDEHPHEANLLALDASKAVGELGWRNRLVFPASLERVVEWHKAVDGGDDPRAVTERQIADYFSMKVRLA